MSLSCRKEKKRKFKKFKNWQKKKIQQQKLFHQILRLMITNELFQLTKE